MRGERIFRGLLLIGVGIFLLLVNFGLVSREFWWQMGRLWPLLLVALGVRLLLRDSVPAACLAALLVLGIFGFAAWQAWGGNTAAAEKKTTVFGLESVAAVEECLLTIDFGAGELNIGAGADKLAAGQLEYYSAKPDWHYNTEDGRGILRVTQTEEPWTGLFRRPDRGGYHWALQLAAGPVWEIEADTGACRAEMDLTELSVGRFDLNTGASSVAVRFGDKQAACRVKIDAGASDIRLSFPRGAGVRVDLTGSLGGNNLAKAGLVRQGDYYTTPDYTAAAVKFDAAVHLGVGNLDAAFR